MEDEGEGSGGQAHADGIEEERGDIRKGVFYDDKGRTPDERDEHQQEMSLERAGHGGRLANWLAAGSKNGSGQSDYGLSPKCKTASFRNYRFPAIIRRSNITSSPGR